MHSGGSKTANERNEIRIAFPLMERSYYKPFLQTEKANHTSLIWKGSNLVEAYIYHKNATTSIYSWLYVTASIFSLWKYSLTLC